MAIAFDRFGRLHKMFRFPKSPPSKKRVYRLEIM